MGGLNGQKRVILRIGGALGDAFGGALQNEMCRIWVHLGVQNAYVLGAITGGISPKNALFLPVFIILRGGKIPATSIIHTPIFSYIYLINSTLAKFAPQTGAHFVFSKRTSGCFPARHTPFESWQWVFPAHNILRTCWMV